MQQGMQQGSVLQKIQAETAEIERLKAQLSASKEQRNQIEYGLSTRAVTRVQSPATRMVTATTIVAESGNPSAGIYKELLEMAMADGEMASTALSEPSAYSLVEATWRWARLGSDAHRRHAAVAARVRTDIPAELPDALGEARWDGMCDGGRRVEAVAATAGDRQREDVRAREAVHRLTSH